MVVFLIPDRCDRCLKKKGDLRQVIFENPSIKQKGKKFIIGYTELAYICKSCLKILK